MPGILQFGELRSVRSAGFVLLAAPGRLFRCPRTGNGKHSVVNAEIVLLNEKGNVVFDTSPASDTEYVPTIDQGLFIASSKSAPDVLLDGGLHRAD